MNHKEYINKLIHEVKSATDPTYGREQVNEYFNEVVKHQQQQKANGQSNKKDTQQTNQSSRVLDKNEIEEISDDEDEEQQQIPVIKETPARVDPPKIRLPTPPLQIKEIPKTSSPPPAKIKPIPKKRKKTAQSVNVNYYFDDEAEVDDDEYEKDDEPPAQKEEELEKVMPKNPVIDGEVIRVFSKYVGFIIMSEMDSDWEKKLKKHVKEKNSIQAKEQLECYNTVWGIVRQTGCWVRDYITSHAKTVDSMKNLHSLLISDRGYAYFEFVDVCKLESEIVSCAIDGTSVKKGWGWNIIFHLRGGREKDLFVSKTWAEFITCWQTLTKQEFLVRAAFLEFAGDRGVNKDTIRDFLASNKMNELAIFLVATLSYFYKFIKDGPQVSKMLRKIDKIWYSIVS